MPCPPETGCRASRLCTGNIVALAVNQAGAGRLETVGCEEPTDYDSVDVSALTTTLDWCFAVGVSLMASCLHLQRAQNRQGARCDLNIGRRE